MRDGFYHRLNELASMVDAGELLDTLSLAMLRDEEQQLIDQAEHAEGLLEDVKENIKRLRDRGAWNELATYLDKRSGLSSLVPESHREELEAIMREAERFIKRAGRKKK
jgi:hypothetical protein